MVRARTIGVVALWVSLAVPSAARGQAADAQRAAAAQALYQQATAEMTAKHYASACRKLEDVTKLVPEGLGAKLTLAQCYEGLGRLASAWSHYAIVAELAAKAGQKERAQKAAAKEAELRPKLATLSVEVPEEVRSIPGLAIERDGFALGEGQWGTPVPVDAGPHEVTATAPGRSPWTQRAEVAEDGVKVAVRVGPLVAEAKEEPKPIADKVAEPERRWQRPVGIGAMALGGAGVAVGAVLGGLALSKNAESKAGYCTSKGLCEGESVRLSQDAVGLATASTAVMAAGGALVVGGLIVFATAPRVGSGKAEGASDGRWSARLDVGFNGVRLKGAW